MMPNMVYFLEVAKELNITRVAKKLYVSQQALSYHIKKLEEQYNTLLFYRKPHLSLTPAGERLYRSLTRIELLERNLQAELDELQRGDYGEIRVGMHSARYAVLAPLVFPAFQEKMPHVSVSIIGGRTRTFEKLVLSNELDLFLGVRSVSYSSIHTIPIAEERLSIVISDSLMRQYFGAEADAYIRKFNDGADLGEMRYIPFIGNNEYGTVLSGEIKQYALSRGISLYTPLSCADVLANLTMVASGRFALFAPQMYTRQVLQMSSRENPLYIFPLADWPVHHVFIGYNSDLYLSKSMQLLIDLIVDAAYICSNG